MLASTFSRQPTDAFQAEQLGGRLLLKTSQNSGSWRVSHLFRAMLRGEKTIWDEAETANDRRVNMESPILGFRNEAIWDLQTVREFIGSVTLARIVLVLFVAGRATSRLSVVS